MAQQNQRKNRLGSQSSIPSRSLAQSDSGQKQSNLSPAELYIYEQTLRNTAASNNPLENISAAHRTTFPTHNELMNGWHQDRINQRLQNSPYQYHFTTAPASNNSTLSRLNSQANASDNSKPNQQSDMDHKRKR
ncbi:unnamed protein product [Rotaria socialis]|uniref:Uncharacterized protein n=1 Tax=Rotaria socialis TaxID=392032 RepID=A0A817SYU9_9BILA|nr:unnamed protein product [Rotaria socialis]CAF3304833.1 unnamed protein product [Rotaria socialis]CAF3427949.1 unnamed protein product [Rotaria socialis]CAF3727301.1 unnamed protein product [Rotaria socialis]CAF3769808.1 unnamed protein product [Rotaria socialis]